MKPELEFYDVKAKGKFKTSTYRMEKRSRKGKRFTYFAVATSPLSGIESWRIVKEKFALENM